VSDDDRVAALVHRQLALVGLAAAALAVTLLVVAVSLHAADGVPAAVLTARYAAVSGAPRPQDVPAGLAPVVWSLLAGLALTTAVLVALVGHLARLAVFAFRSEVH